MDRENIGLNDAMRAIAEAAPQRFYATHPSPCPYLPGRLERKVFTELKGGDADSLHDLLADNGFRRNQVIAYRPFCESCDACVPVRVRAGDFAPKKWMRRILARNADLVMSKKPARATREQYELFSGYLGARHAEGGMADMSFEEYQAMVEETAVTTEVVEFRDQTGTLAGACLIDLLADSISLIYSFFLTDAAAEANSLGSAVILRLVERARADGQAYVYLGYWIAESQAMAYKSRFQPVEALGRGGWRLLE